MRRVERYRWKVESPTPPGRRTKTRCSSRDDFVLEQMQGRTLVTVQEHKDQGAGLTSVDTPKFAKTDTDGFASQHRTCPGWRARCLGDMTSPGSVAKSKMASRSVRLDHLIQIHICRSQISFAKVAPCMGRRLFATPHNMARRASLTGDGRDRSAGAAVLIDQRHGHAQRIICRSLGGGKGTAWEALPAFVCTAGRKHREAGFEAVVSRA